MERPNPTPERKSSIVAAIALLVFGLVVLVPSGLCTGMVLFTSIMQAVLHPALRNEFGMSGIALVVGGPFVAGGFAMVWYGAKELVNYFRK